MAHILIPETSVSFLLGIDHRHRSRQEAVTAACGLRVFWFLPIFLITTPLWCTDEASIVRWKEGSSYSDRLLYNGFSYKTIRVSDERDPSLSLSLALSASRDNCPGKSRKCISALVLVMNEGSYRFDVEPERFECHCENKKQEVLSLYRLPGYLRHAAPAGALLTANTVIPGSTLRGILYFNGRCADYVVDIPINFPAGRKLIFEFPFAQGAR